MDQLNRFWRGFFRFGEGRRGEGGALEEGEGDVKGDCIQYLKESLFIYL